MLLDISATEDSFVVNEFESAEANTDSIRPSLANLYQVTDGTDARSDTPYAPLSRAFLLVSLRPSSEHRP
jgi:hypothetical protein